MSVSGIWPRDASACGNEQLRSTTPARSRRSEPKAQPSVLRRLLPWWLASAGAGLLGAFVLDIAGNGAQRPLVLLYGVVHTASVLLVTAWMSKRPDAPPAEEHEPRFPEVPPPPDTAAPAGPIPDPWAADTVPVLPAADSSPTFRP